ncbi:MAG TPA: aldo/keto reductase [Dehalococcoidia bacterium]|nr:aldo/keto reductase [Dehalococcoidia bacterium]
MEYRRFGSTTFEVSRLGLGCMSMSGAYGSADDAESIATLHRAFDLGINFIDTSASYGNGHNHELIRKALHGRRERIVIHSKSGGIRTDDGRNLGGGSPEYLTMVCERSLQGLGIESLDIFCLSRVDAQVPVEESVGAMAKLVEQGKVRYIALSEAGPESIRRANKVHPIVSLQMAYSVWEREAETGNLEACREFGMGFMAYSALGRGFLAGLFHDVNELPEGDNRRNSARFSPEGMEQSRKLLATIEEVAKEASATPAQVSLAWVLAQGPDIVPIPGCKSVAHLEDNLRALELNLDEGQMTRLNALMPPNPANGPREQLYRPRS